MKPVVSVIIPAYNEEDLLPLCLASLANQKTTAAYEVIVADRDSTDATPNICRRFGVRRVNDHRIGRSWGRNAGAAHAYGEILAFTEADCILPPNWVETIVQLLKRDSDLVGVTGGIRFIHPQNIFERLGPYTLNIGNILYRLRFGHTILRGTSFAVRQSLFNTIGKFSSAEAPFDDVAFGIRAARFGKIKFTEDLTVQTSPRRIHGRILPYIRDYLMGYTNIFLLGRRGDDSWFANIRRVTG